MPRISRVAVCAGMLALLIAGCMVPARTKPRMGPSPFVAHVSYESAPALIPFKRTAGDLPIVLAETDRGKLWMLVDTGCDAVVFTPHTAARAALNVKEIDAYGRDYAGTAHRINGVAPVSNLTLGPAHFFGFYSVVNEIGNLTDKDHPPGGVAGLPLFGDALLTIDYSRNCLIVEPGQLPPPDGIDILPMTISSGKIVVPFWLGDREISLVLDTGFSGFLVIPHNQSANFPGAETKLAHGSVKCFYTTQNIDLAQLTDDLRIGRHTIQQPIVAVGDGTAAMIGAQYLKHFVVTIDQRNHRIRFATPEKRTLFLPAFGREAEHEITMIDRLMERPTSQPAADASDLDQ
jgi:predicted aspartyl protease